MDCFWILLLIAVRMEHDACFPNVIYVKNLLPVPLVLDVPSIDSLFQPVLWSSKIRSLSLMYMPWVQWCLQGLLVKGAFHTLKSRYWCVILMVWVWALVVLVGAVVAVVDDGNLNAVVSVAAVQDICAVAGAAVQDNADQDVVAVVDDVSIFGCHVLDDAFCRHGLAGRRASTFVVAVGCVDCAALQD